MLFFRRTSPHWLFSVIIIIIVDVGYPCGRLSVLSSAFAVAIVCAKYVPIFTSRARYPMYLGTECVQQLHYTNKRNTLAKLPLYHIDQTLSTNCLHTAAALRGGEGAMPPINAACFLPSAPIWVPRKNKK